MNLKFVLPAAARSLAPAVLVVITGCDKPAAPPAAPPKQAVTVARVEQKQLVEWQEFTGHAEAIDSVDVRPRVSGYIKNVRFQSGQLVKKGDVLFVIDPRWLQADYDRLSAEANRARVQSDNAKREADRTAKLLANHAISAEEADERTARFEEAKAAAVAADAACEYAKLDLDYTEVRAPIDGRVSRAYFTEGNYVTGGSGNGTLLTTIVSVDPVYVYADVDEDTLLKYNALVAANKMDTDTNGHTPVQLELADESDFPRSGRVESFDNHVDANTGSILLRAVFPNPDGRIVPGLFARIRLPVSARHPALLVADRAIGTDQAQKYVLTLSPSNTVAYQSVDLGPEVGDKRIVRAGLHAGDKIVVNGMQRVRPGMPVEPQEETEQAPTNMARR